MIGLKSIYDFITARNIFWLIILLVFILLPLLSLNAGISGDEPVHYQQAEYVNNYFSSNKTDQAALNTPYTNLKYYGQVLDNISYRLNTLLNSHSPYTTRHFLAALTGALLILFSGLITVSLGGYSAGIITVLFLLLSPRILGHSLNNLKDVPFALGYLMTLWGLVESVKIFPKIKLSHMSALTIGFGIAFGIRAGGLIIIPMVFLFSFLNWIKYNYGKDFKTWLPWWTGIKIFSALTLAISVGYLLGILYWPYALQDPLRNPFESLKMMTNYEVSIRQVFNGEWIWSEKLPWFYGLKWIIISSPIVILAGFVIHIVFIKRLSWVITALLFFACLFPVFWTILKGSNLYGGWRQLLFVYPLICIISALGWWWLYSRFKPLLLKLLFVGILVFGLSGPALHTIRNHPVEYAYFNQFVGGINHVNGIYETDYYFHGVKRATKWLEKRISESENFVPVTVASNFPISEYYRSTSTTFTTNYMNYYNRGKFDWDYGIFSSTYLDPAQLRNKKWPPENTIYQVFVDDVPVCIVIERKNKFDLEGLKQYRQSNFLAADSLYNLALQSDPDNETALLYSAWTKRHLLLFEESDAIADILLSRHPLSDNAQDIKARNAISTANYDRAKKILSALLKQNYKFLPAYEQMGILNDSLSNYPEVARYLKLGYQMGLNDPTNLKSLIRALEINGSKAQAEEFRMILNK